MGLVSLLFKEPLLFLLLAVPLLYSIIAHEMAHGFVAYLFGDDTAKRMGRLSLNPLVHIDPVGMLALLFVGFGWAKPVPVNYYNFKNFRLGLIFVSLAGCIANMIIAGLAVFLLKTPAVNSNQVISAILIITAKINVILVAFNLIPIPPLDGSKILMGFLPADAQISFSRLEPYGFYILIILIMTGFLNPVINFLQRIIFSIIGG